MSVPRSLLAGGLCALVCSACANAPPTANGILPTDPTLFVMPARALCEPGRYDDPAEDGQIEDAELLEASGLVTSPRNPGVLWAHNDSGDGARVFAMTTAGASLGQLALPDIEAIDIEDIAAGPCPDLVTPCLYLADTGNNLYERERLFVYAVPEPEVSAQKPLADGAVASRVWRYPLLVPDAPANIEAMVVMPNATQILFYEKIEGAEARIFSYRAPWIEDTDALLVQTDTFTPPGLDIEGGHLITGADLHTSGRSLALRTYTGVWEVRFDVDAGQTPDTIDDSQIVEAFLGPLGEPQGETVAYDEEGSGIWTLSEVPDRTPGPPLHRALCIR